MPLFAVIGLDVPPHSMPLREAHRAAHRDYVLAQDRPVRLAGAMYDRQDNQCGSLLILEAPDADSVRAWFEQEPFYRNGVYGQFVVVEWRLALNRLPPMPDWRSAKGPVSSEDSSP
jgi:uncharacterized protein